MTLTPLENRLIQTLRDRGIDAGDVRDLILRARKEPRIAWGYWLRWRESNVRGRCARSRWGMVARQIAAELMLVAAPPFLADDPPEDAPLAWTPDAEPPEDFPIAWTPGAER